MKLALYLLGAIWLAACGGGEDVPMGPDIVTIGPADRPAQLRVPAGYDHALGAPLLLILHGYGATGPVQLAYSRLSDVPALILAPNGTVNQDDKAFWNATDSCCDFYDSGVDDVSYLDGLFAEVQATYHVDETQVYAWGHSNGGAMAYRLACDFADRFAAIVSLAGPSYKNASLCEPSQPVSVLQVHGTDDDIALWDGGTDCVGFPCEYPSIPEHLSNWASYNGCGNTETAGAAYDLEANLEGDETESFRRDGCPSGIDVELWKMNGGGHVPALAPDSGDYFWAWLTAHAR